MAKSKEKFIYTQLRLATLTYGMRDRCLDKTRTREIVGTYNNGKVKYKYFWHCAKCGFSSGDKGQFEADHVQEIGGYRGDWNVVIERMFDEDNMQALCLGCHKRKTAGFAASRLFKRKA